MNKWEGANDEVLYEMWTRNDDLKRKCVAENDRIAEEIMKRKRPKDMPYEGSKSIKEAGYKITFTNRVYHTVDVEKVLDIARKTKTEDKMKKLFKFKMELNKKAWDVFDDTDCANYETAITDKLGKPGLKVEEVE